MKQLADGAAARQRHTGQATRKGHDPETLIEHAMRGLRARGRSGRRGNPTALLEALARRPLGRAGSAAIRKD